MSHIVLPDATIKTNGKKTKTPRQYDSILKGALALYFVDKVQLKKELQEAIELELNEVKQKAESFAKIASE